MKKRIEDAIKYKENGDYEIAEAILLELCDYNIKECKKEYLDAYVELAYLYDCQEKHDIASSMYKESIKLNDARSYNNLGANYLGGVGVKQDIDYGIKLLRKSAELGSANAYFSLYYAYSKFSDAGDPYEMLIKSAEFGSPIGQYKLAEKYEKELRYEEALKLYRYAIKNGYKRYDDWLNEDDTFCIQHMKLKKSFNYKFIYFNLVKIFFKSNEFEKMYYNRFKTNEWLRKIYSVTLILFNLNDEKYKNLKFYFGKGGKIKSIIIEFPTKDFLECECNYIALCEGENKELFIYTSEYYSSLKCFKLCKIDENENRYSYSNETNNLFEFSNAIKQEIVDGK